MYCEKCGSKNTPEAVYCQKCGNLFEGAGEQETIVASRREETSIEKEKRILSIRPTLFYVKVGYGLAVLAAFLLVAFFGFLSGIIDFSVSAWIFVLAGLALLLVPAYFHLKQKMVLYTLTDSKVEIDEGLISRTTRNVPLRIIQDVTVSASVFQRMLGLGNIEIENANENDNNVILRNVDAPKEIAKELLDQMRRLNR